MNENPIESSIKDPIESSIESSIKGPIESSIKNPNENLVDNFVDHKKIHKNDGTVLIIAIIICTIVAVGGAIVALFIGEKMKAEEREKRSSEVVVENEGELTKKKYGKTKVQTEVKTEDEVDASTAEKDTETSEKDKAKYLTPEGWGVKFKYPEGVVDVKYDLQQANYDGQLQILSIVTKEKIYDVNICGGKEAYKHYPFFLGSVSRWNPKEKHEEWEVSPLSAGAILSLKVEGIEYFVNPNYGNGCEIGGQNHPAYVEAIELSKKLIDSMEKK